jgi:signal transduction histidine kinase
MPGAEANENGMLNFSPARYRDIGGFRETGSDTTVGTVHDLGNLIQVASSGLNILSRDPHVSAAPALLSIVGGARTALERAHAVVRDTIARADRNQLNVELVSVGPCLIEIQTLVGVSWNPDLQLEVLIAPDLPQVRCDRLAFQNAVLNLLFNARDAMPDGGLVSIEAAASHFGPAEVVEVRVKDRGIGMSQETIVRAFEPFFTTKGSGLGGIGLPSVKRFAEDHGGKVDVRSVLGFGTSVTLRLPAAPSIDGAPDSRSTLIKEFWR